mgnify:CR=1 FL=1
MIYAAALIAVMLAFAGAVYQAFGMGIDSQIAKQAAADGRQALENKHIAEAVDAALGVTATAIAKLRPRYTTIQQEMRHESSTNTIYADCKLPAPGLRIVNDALSATPKSPASGAAGSGQLPGVVAPAG